MSLLKSIFQSTLYLPLIMRSRLTAGDEAFARVLESSQVTDQKNQVFQYNRVLTTKLMIFYCLGLEILHKLCNTRNASAIDLACGPGHYSLLMARHLGLASVLGVDLSEPMLEVAMQNAKDEHMVDTVKFQQEDATKLENIGSASFDLATMTFAIHHLPTLSDVSACLMQMERITKPDGLVFIQDLRRLNCEKLTKDFINLSSGYYLSEGLDAFYDDFYQSMHAAWTAEELEQAVPRDSKRKWILMMPGGIPVLQFLIGIPASQSDLFLHNKNLWKDASCPCPQEFRGELALTRLFVRLSHRKIVK